MNNDYLYFRSIIFFVLFGIVALIYFLDYYPLAIIEIKTGYCTNMDTTVYLTRPSDEDNDVMGVYYYKTDIYNSINGTYIGEGNGGTGTFNNSYGISAGINSDLTDKYPYSAYRGNIPSWLCGYVSHGNLKIYKTVQFYIILSVSFYILNKV
jgi:hypothetical protein